MTDTLCAVDGCSRPIPDTAFVCTSCGTKLATLLGLVPGILDDIDDVVRRQVRFTTGTTRGSNERPLPFNPAAAESKTVLISTLTYWAGNIAETRGHDMPDRVSNYLVANIGWLRAQSIAADAFDELTTAIRQARAVTDRPVEKRYAGPCTAAIPMISTVTGDPLGYDRECGTDLYAKETGNTVTCKECGAEYDLAERRRWLLEQAADRLLPAAEMARAVDGLGIPVTKAKIAGWKTRNRIQVHPGPNGQDLYRVSDVVALVHQAAQKRGDIA